MRSSRSACFASIAIAASTYAMPALAQAPATAFDGDWWVALVCDDAQDAKGVVKGYRFEFAARIRDGHLHAQYQAVGENASLTWDGDVAPDGALAIRAEGRTGQPGYTVGSVGPGTPYRYTMSGRLSGTAGEAVRRELRPCRATFARRGSVG